jgi:hypothetical protein
MVGRTDSGAAVADADDELVKEQFPQRRPRVKSRAGRTEYSHYTPRPIETNWTYFMKCVQLLSKIISKFHIIQLDVDKDQLMLCAHSRGAKGYPKEDSPHFENTNYHELTQINDPCLVYGHCKLILASFRGFTWGEAEISTLKAIQRLEKMDSGCKPAKKDSCNKRKESDAKQWVYGYFIEQGHRYRGPLLSYDM